MEKLTLHFLERKVHNLTGIHLREKYVNSIRAFKILELTGFDASGSDIDSPCQRWVEKTEA
jgi:hypothetical protein